MPTYDEMAVPRPVPLDRGPSVGIAATLSIWFASVLALASVGAFAGSPTQPPLGLFLAVVLPPLLFALLYRLSGRFRTFALAIDLRWLTAFQPWRVIGVTFLALYAFGLLPGLFAWPAGLGDIAIGTTAPWIAMALVRRPAFASSQVFVVWNLLGILDLVVAVGTGAISSMLASGAPGEVTTAPMAQLPLVLIPAYLVPLFVMLHLTSLFQERRLSTVL